MTIETPEQTRRRLLIEKVLHLAEMAAPENGASLGERENAMRLGQKLIARHDLSLEECEAAALAREAANHRAARRPPPAPRPPVGPFGNGAFSRTTTTNVGMGGTSGIWFEIRFG